MAVKPILFNTDMVRALLDGRKTVTRRVVKYTTNDVYDAACANGLWHETYDPKNPPGDLVALYVNRIKIFPYHPGDILYVRETWSTQQDMQCLGITTGECPHKNCESADGPCFGHKYIYKAELTDHLPYGEKWRPSIHMPKEAARIFLRVTGVRVERLQDITDDDIVAEGLKIGCYFDELWDKTIKPTDHALYGWAANPWVWVIEFKRISKEEAL